jgi:signal transduction histidine kinase
MDLENRPVQIPFRFHPRAFLALGADLVTNDVVAVCELVKNSYDAFAKNVWVRFGHSDDEGPYIEIQDDGCGMTRPIIEDVWGVIATPFKQNNPEAVRGDKRRRVSGEKGLGRLSAARLGSRLWMLTKEKHSPCWLVQVDWAAIAGSMSMDNCNLALEEYVDDTPFSNSGTIIRIFDLADEWDDDMISDLRENLSRLISPFSEENDIAIFVDDGKNNDAEQLMIAAPEFLAHPKYCLRGKFDSAGTVFCEYQFSSFDARDPRARTRRFDLKWEQIYRSPSISDSDKKVIAETGPGCGPFDFEFRVWDIGAEDIEEIHKNFEIQKNAIRRAIRAHKGISVYRDKILVLPKSDGGRDWLGLDLRRVSRLGSRISTSQIVGHVQITAEYNPDISDTSDRERLVSTKEEKAFEVLLKVAVGLLENERDIDRRKPEREKPLENLFQELSTEQLVEDVASLADEGASAQKVIPLINRFSQTMIRAKETIQQRFIYYNRLATIGTISQALVHEIRNRTTIIGSFFDKAQPEVPNTFPAYAESFSSADKAVDTLERLADVFAPLANRSFNRLKRYTNLNQQIHECIALHNKEIEKMGINVEVSLETNMQVAIDPGELDAVLLNLISNSMYWLSRVDPNNRTICFRAKTINQGDRVEVSVDDSGLGIDEEDVDKIMWPGVTRKPGGIGMGLTVVAEIISEYGGQLSITHPGMLGGATFNFDMAIKKGVDQ